MSSADDRARQAEMDAARAREMAEEYVESRERSAAALPGPEAAYVGVTGRMVREWIRGVLLPPAVRRMYDIGMGIERFEVPTEAGNVVVIPAPAKVQVDALKSLISTGLPGQVGIVDADDNALPGVFALGALDLDAARKEAHGERYITAGEPLNPNLAPMEERVAAGEFEMVEVIEGVGAENPTDDRAPGPLPPAPETLEQRILRERRERRANNGNGKHT